MAAIVGCFAMASCGCGGCNGAVSSSSENPFAATPKSIYELPRDLLAGLATPALVVYLDRVRDNVQRMIGYVGTADRWRPHLKTTKIPEVWRELLVHGVRQFKCATTREASVFADLAKAEGIAVDLLIAYPHRGPALRCIAEIADRASATTLSLLVEDPELVASLPKSVSVFVDVNPGMNRTGIPMQDADAITAVARAAGERFRGLHFYDGHLHDADLAARRAAIFAGYERVMELVSALADAGIPVGEVITAGTPAFPHALQFERFATSATFVHRVSPGTVVFHDQRSEIDNPDVDLQPAALVLSRIISHPAADIATCDAGSKSVAAEAGDPCAFVLGDDTLQALTPSEEHLPLRVAKAPLPPRGKTVLLVPRHVCPTVNLAEVAVLFEDNGTTRMVPVAARAH